MPNYTFFFTGFAEWENKATSAANSDVVECIERIEERLAER